MTHAFTVIIDAPDLLVAERVRDRAAGAVEDFIESSRPDFAIDIGRLVEIETCQLVGIKEGREVDLGTIPLTPEMKAREIARDYGDLDDEESEGSTMLGAMRDLIKWMREQGKLTAAIPEVKPPAVEQDANDLAAIAAAKEEHESEGSLEIDDSAMVSFSADRGAYVQAWVWVDDASIEAKGGINPETAEEGEGT